MEEVGVKPIASITVQQEEKEELPKRKSIRLPDYDYSQAGLYFITICTHQQHCTLGRIMDDVMLLNKCGQIVREEWIRSAGIRKEIELAEYMIMPNHFHAIVVITEQSRGDRLVARPPTDTSGLRPNGAVQGSVGALIAGFKSAVTARMNTIQKTPGKKFWQRNYWEHIIRDQKSYEDIANYIINNPINWKKDSMYRDVFVLNDEGSR
jgi:putative transposase